MTVDAKRALLGSNHLIPRPGDRVIAVTGKALGKLLLIESGFVRAGLKKLSLARMALPTDIRYRGNTWWRRAVITMTIVARGRRQVLFFIERFGMDTGLVLRILIIGNPEPPHIVSAGVAL